MSNLLALSAYVFNLMKSIFSLATSNILTGFMTYVGLFGAAATVFHYAINGHKHNDNTLR